MGCFWLQNGFIQVDGDKMSKSLGIFVTIRELVQTAKVGGIQWPGEVIRLAMLTTHYRQPIDFNQHSLEQASIALSQFATFGRADTEAKPSSAFVEALSDDLNTPLAISELHRLLRLARTGTDEMLQKMSRPGAMLTDEDYSSSRQLAAGLRWIGIDIARFDARWLEKQANARLTVDEQEVTRQMIAARAAARKAKNFAEADRIRAELDAMGIALKDAKDPKTGELVTTWEVKR
jgi:cysteinyl-tRNA synthetase